jgi:hypothetical protein
MKTISARDIVFTAGLCAYEDYREMEAFGKWRRDFPESFPGLPGDIPDESAFRRVLQYLNPPGLQRGLVNIDGNGGADFMW